MIVIMKIVITMIVKVMNVLIYLIQGHHLHLFKYILPNHIPFTKKEILFRFKSFKFDTSKMTHIYSFFVKYFENGFR